VFHLQKQQQHHQLITGHRLAIAPFDDGGRRRRGPVTRQKLRDHPRIFPMGVEKCANVELLLFGHIVYMLDKSSIVKPEEKMARIVVEIVNGKGDLRADGASAEELIYAGLIAVCAAEQITRHRTNEDAADVEFRRGIGRIMRIFSAEGFTHKLHSSKMTES